MSGRVISEGSTRLLLPTLPEDYTALRDAVAWRGLAVPEGGLEPDAVLVMLEGWSRAAVGSAGLGALAGDEVVVSLAVRDCPADGVVGNTQRLSDDDRIARQTLTFGLPRVRQNRVPLLSDTL